MKKRKTTLLLFAVLIALFVLPFTAHAATRISRTAYVGDSFKLKVTGTRKKPKWSSSNKKVATVNKKGIVRAKKAGKATITAKVNGKKLKCFLTVLNLPTPAPAPTPAPTPTPTPVVDRWNGSAAVSAIQIVDKTVVKGKVLVTVRNNYRFGSILTATCHFTKNGTEVRTTQDFLYMSPGWEGDLFFTVGNTEPDHYSVDFSVREPYVVDCVGSWIKVVDSYQDNSSMLHIVVRNNGPAAVSDSKIVVKFIDPSGQVVDIESRSSGPIGAYETKDVLMLTISDVANRIEVRIADAYKRK